MTFEETLAGLRNGDFTALDPQLDQIVAWFDEGRFADHPAELNEALSCACFNGRTPIVERFLDAGLSPLAGNLTGLDGFHWAANRGQLLTVKLLIDRGVNMETLSSFGGTVLGTAVWSTLNEPKPDQVAIVDALLTAGADPEGARIQELGFPTSNERLNGVLRLHGVA